jgi:hypothetical protein
MIVLDATTISAVGFGVSAPAGCELHAVDGDPVSDPAAIHRIGAVFARGSLVC